MDKWLKNVAAWSDSSTITCSLTQPIQFDTFITWQVVLMKGYLMSSDRAMKLLTAKQVGDHHCTVGYISLSISHAPVQSYTDLCHSKPVHKEAHKQKMLKMFHLRWRHIWDGYCNTAQTHRELSWHSASACAPQAYHFHLMNGVDWIGRQAWGEKGVGEK